jgi:hypothetical protein
LIFETLLWARGEFPTYALKSAKDLGNIVKLYPKWARTLPSFIYFSWNIYKAPHSTIFSNIKVDI